MLSISTIWKNPSFVCSRPSQSSSFLLSSTRSYVSNRYQEFLQIEEKRKQPEVVTATSEEGAYSVVESIRYGPISVPIMVEKMLHKMNSVYEKKKKVVLPNGGTYKQITRYNN